MCNILSSPALAVHQPWPVEVSSTVTVSPTLTPSSPSPTDSKSYSARAVKLILANIFVALQIFFLLFTNMMDNISLSSVSLNISSLLVDCKLSLLLSV